MRITALIADPSRIQHRRYDSATGSGTTGLHVGFHAKARSGLVVLNRAATGLDIGLDPKACSGLVMLNRASTAFYVRFDRH